MEILDRAVHRMDAQIIGDVVAVVLERRWKEGQQPQAGDAQILQIIQFLNQARKIADPVAIAVLERADVQLIDDRVLDTRADPLRCPAVLPCPVPRRASRQLTRFRLENDHCQEEEVSYSTRTAGRESGAELPANPPKFPWPLPPYKGGVAVQTSPSSSRSERNARRDSSPAPPA